MSWFVATLRDDVDPGLQTGALVHRFEWLTVELAASGEDVSSIALFAAAGPAAAGDAVAPEVYLTPGCEPFLGALLAELEVRACDPPAPERLVRLGGGAEWRPGVVAQRRAS